MTGMLKLDSTELRQLDSADPHSLRKALEDVAFYAERMGFSAHDRRYALTETLVGQIILRDGEQGFVSCDELKERVGEILEHLVLSIAYEHGDEGVLFNTLQTSAAYKPIIDAVCANMMLALKTIRAEHA